MNTTTSYTDTPRHNNPHSYCPLKYRLTCCPHASLGSPAQLLLTAMDCTPPCDSSPTWSCNTSPCPPSWRRHTSTWPSMLALSTALMSPTWNNATSITTLLCCCRTWVHLPSSARFHTRTEPSNDPEYNLFATSRVVGGNEVSNGVVGRFQLTSTLDNDGYRSRGWQNMTQTMIERNM